MNKVFQVNIGGMVFSVDDLAYEKLKNYIDSLRSHFSKTEGREEIISDIESRIGEILKERMRPSREVVNMEDVDYIVSAMGNPEDFSGAEEEQSNSNTYNSSGRQKDYPNSGTQSGERRLFRDPDNKRLGGVCSGLSLYFGISDPIWLRLAFAIAFFTFGSGLLLYIILWIVIPKARTITDKMQMRGEDVNIHNIKKNFSDGVNDFKDGVRNFTKSPYVRKVETGGNRFFSFMEEFFYTVGTVFIKLLSWIMVVAGIFLLVLLILTSFGITHNFSDLPGLISVGDHNQIAVIGLALVFGIPLLAIIVKGIKMIFHLKIRTHLLNMAFLFIWILGLAASVYSGTIFIENFSHKSTVSREFAIPTQHSDTLQLDLVRVENAKSISHLHIYTDDDDPYILSDKSNYFTRDVKIKIEKSTDSAFHLTEILSSNGFTNAEAKNNSNAIEYTYKQNGNKLSLNAYCSFPSRIAWRKQRVRLILEVPEGKTVYFGTSMTNFLDDVKNTTDTYDEDMLGHYWKMGEDQLKCTDSEEPEQKHHHRHTTRTSSYEYNY